MTCRVLLEELRQIATTADRMKMPTTAIDSMLDIFDVISECIAPDQLILLVANMILEHLDAFEAYHPSETWLRDHIMYLISIAHNHHELAALSSEFPEFDYDTPGSNALVSACMLLWVGASQVNQHLVRRRRLKGAIVSIYSAILDIHKEKRNPALWRAWRTAALAQDNASNTNLEVDETLSESVFSLQAQIVAETDSDAEEINLAWQFWQTLIEQIEPLLDLEKAVQVKSIEVIPECEACASKFPNLPECNAFFREYIYQSVQAALTCMKKVYNDNNLEIQKPNSSWYSSSGQVARRWIVHSGKQFMGFITCCSCCDSSSGTSIRSERCRIHW